MSVSRRALPRPSLGWWLFCALLAVPVAFFAWGLRRPALDEVWQLQAELSLGTRPPLDEAERQLLAGVLQRYPAVADSFLQERRAGFISMHDDGWVSTPDAYLLRRDAAVMSRLRVTPSLAVEKPIEVCAAVPEVQHCDTASRQQPFVWDLPVAGPFPQLVEVHLRGVGKNTNNRRWVRLETEAAP